MKHYFLVAKDVLRPDGDLVLGLEEREAKPVPVLDRVMARFKPRPPHLLDSDDFVVDHIASISGCRRVLPRSGPISSACFASPEAQSAFHPDANAHGVAFAPSDDQKVGEDKQANSLFFEILTTTAPRCARRNERGACSAVRARLRPIWR